MSRFSNLEFHRSGIGLLTDPRDTDPGSAIYLENAVGSTRPLRFCGCSVGRRRACRHLTELGAQIKLFRRRYQNRAWGDVFGATRWHRLAQILFEGDPQPFAEALVSQVRCGERVVVRITAASGETLVDLLEHSPATLRLLERMSKVPATDGFLDRGGVIDKLAVFLRTAEEQHLNRAGLKTNRQSFEGSVWYRVAYHAFREYEEKGRIEPGVDLDTGAFTLTYWRDRANPVLRIAVPRARVRAVLALLQEEPADARRTPVAALPLLPLLRLFADDSARRSLVGKLQGLIDPDEDQPVADLELQKFRYGSSLLYIPEAEVLADLEDEDEAVSLTKRQLKSQRIPARAAEAEQIVSPPQPVLEDPIKELRILREFDYVEIAADEERTAVRYGFGDETIALEDLVEAKGRGLPYLESEHGWIDLSAPELASLTPLADRRSKTSRSRALQLSSAQILRIKSSTSKPVRIAGDGGRAAIIERLLELRPSQPLPPLAGLNSQLRAYQQIGVEWLHFLWENQLAGLLCDDMGLGKTHQAMALMVLLREHYGVEEPFLVICPRTVISHWRNKLRDHAPALEPVVYHGPQRDLDAALGQGGLLIASYGVLRNDARKLRKVDWGLIVFDEIQQIKNRETQAYKAGFSLPARMKLGLTGTPIENSLAELKNLFDLILPGYLGEDDDYFDRFGTGIRDEPDEAAIAALRRIVAPFVLRRLKTNVLDELPEKIEDLRTCSLSTEQRQLYQQTISTRGAALADRIRNGNEPLPYIHIFAVLNLLKQICDHPALALGHPDEWREHDSRKWDLFQELLDESLGSGQKVVVFTQYLGMIRIMQQYLEDLGVSHATLTGSTRKRGDVVDRFNTEKDCRVFLGSLRAGGTGIDLVGGSVVIHYDRWWNAAKEDQATDRVYRIGQKRAVQVFKLLAEDTLEERIDMMIERKRRLLGDVVQADHPQLGKIFTREELLELLRQIE